jgi:hypothetical protein
MEDENVRCIEPRTSGRTYREIKQRTGFSKGEAQQFAGGRRKRVIMYDASAKNAKVLARPTLFLFFLLLFSRPKLFAEIPFSLPPDVLPGGELIGFQREPQ